jgi:hypothetical protein
MEPVRITAIFKHEKRDIGKFCKLGESVDQEELTLFM